MTKKQEKFGIVLFIILFSYFLILMDNSIIFTSSSQIGQGLHMNEASLSWVSNAYTITFGGFLLLMGRVGDFIGRKRIFLIGLILFGISSLAVGLSQNAAQIIIFRAIQGIGSSIIAPSSLALLLEHYEGNMRARAISLYGVTAGIGSSAGLLIGGGLTSLISWRAGFLINVPFALFLIILTIMKLSNSEVKKQKIDVLGAVLSVAVSSLFVYGITVSNIWLIVISLVLLVGFIFLEKSRSYALMNLELFKNRVRSGAYIARFLFMMAMLTYWFIVPQIMQELYHFTALQAGMGFLPLTIVNFAAALYLPKITAKLGNGRVMLTGQIILLIGILISAVIDPHAGYWVTIGLPMILIGWGQGWLLAPLTAAGVYDTTPELAGGASGLTNTMHQLGGPVGLSLTVFFTSSIVNIGSYYHAVMYFIVGFLTVGLVVLLITNRESEK